jgi:transposase
MPRRIRSIKKLKKHIKDWALNSQGWLLANKNEIFNITQIDEEAHKDSTFYKERWINEDGLEQKLIVTYSIKYRNYQRKIRDEQVDRARRLIATNPTKLKKPKQNDFKRFIAKRSVTGDGELAEKELYSIDVSVIEAEAAFDGFYGVCTNLDDEPAAIIKINHKRWEIEECFRIMKSEFKARPVYLQRDDRIKAHFTTCFISLLIFRLLEKRLGDKFTCPQIIQGLRDLNFFEIPSEGYAPAYTRTDFTDALHEAFGFRTDYQILTNSFMKKIIKNSKA